MRIGSTLSRIWWTGVGVAVGLFILRTILVGIQNYGGPISAAGPFVGHYTGINT